MMQDFKTRYDEQIEDLSILNDFIILCNRRKTENNKNGVIYIETVVILYPNADPWLTKIY